MKTKAITILVVLALAGAISMIWAQTQTLTAAKIEAKTEMKAEEGMKMACPADMQKCCPMCGMMVLRFLWDRSGGESKS